MADLKIKPSTGTGNKLILESQDGTDVLTTSDSGVASIILPAGHVLQVLQAQKTDTTTVTSTSFVDVSSLEIAITPSATSSKILVYSMLLCVGTVGQSGGFSRVVRSVPSTDTVVGIGDTAGSRIRTGAMGYAPDQGDTRHHSTVWLDSPATTSAITYNTQVSSAAHPVYVNLTQNDGDSAGYGRGVSTLTVMEIAG